MAALPNTATFRGSDAALGDLLAALAHVDIDRTPAERRQLDLLSELRARLIENRFQLAAVGQFKRGKSSLLNALLETDVLPSGIVPLTAIPTFITHSAQPRISVTKIDGRVSERRKLSSAELKADLAALVTETGNPRNVKGVERVDIGLPSPLLADGLTVIDTPGIGSLEHHNTDVAMAALPHCDAALVVLSPDPLITEAEASYLLDIRRHASAVIPVLNKADLLDADEEHDALAYVDRALQQVGIETKISVASSRNPDLLKAGIDALRNRIGRMVIRDSDRLLKHAVAIKGRSAIGDLIFQNDLGLAALTAPSEQLERARSDLAVSAVHIRQEARDIGDMLEGERDRMLRDLDVEAERLGANVHNSLAAAIEELTAVPADRDHAFASLTAKMAGELIEGYAALGHAQHARLEKLEHRFGGRVAGLLAQARTHAGEALGIVAAEIETRILFRREASLAWAVRQSESMNPLPRGFWDGLLPAPWRAVRVRAFLHQEADRLVTKNIERMRWSLHQAIVNAVRQYRRDLSDALDETFLSVTGLVERAAEMRGIAEDHAEVAIALRRDWGQLLESSLASLTESFSGNPSHGVAQHGNETKELRPG